MLSAEVSGLDSNYGLSKNKGWYQREQAAKIIQRMWWAYIRKRLFKLLKKAIRASEHCISYEILKRVSPLEAELLKEPTIECKVRFRFAGPNFPPFVLFKIFCNSKGHGSQYITGKNVITSTSEAAVDACKLMGYRKYYNQMLQDELNYKKYGITDEIDVATIKDYMQYISHLDETPAYFGGRHNYWRKLSLEDLPRTMIVYDIMDYAQSGKLSHRLKEELPFLLLSPQNEETYHAQLLAVCRVRIEPAHMTAEEAKTTERVPKCLPTVDECPIPCLTTTTLPRAIRKTAHKSTQRRSYQAREKIAKMRKSYRAERKKEEQKLSYRPETMSARHANLSLFQDEDWEQEAIKLYDWSRTLRTEDISED